MAGKDFARFCHLQLPATAPIGGVAGAPSATRGAQQLQGGAALQGLYASRLHIVDELLIKRDQLNFVLRLAPTRRSKAKKHAQYTQADQKLGQSKTKTSHRVDARQSVFCAVFL